MKNEVGNKYGKLTVIKKAERKENNQGVYWVCVCDCGNTTVVRGNFLRVGKTKSCGCLRKERVSTYMTFRVKELNPGYKYGESVKDSMRDTLPPEPKKKPAELKRGVRRRRGRPTGYKMSEESKQKIAEAKVGKKHTRETKEKISYTLREGKNTASINQILKTDLDTLRMRRSGSGYLFVSVPSGEKHVAASPIPVHRFVAEKYLRCKIPLSSPIHHINGDVDEYSLGNLYVCPDINEHIDIHRAGINVKSNLRSLKKRLDCGEEIW